MAKVNEFETDKLDKDIKEHQERKERKKDTIKAMVHGMMKAIQYGKKKRSKYLLKR